MQLYSDHRIKVENRKMKKIISSALLLIAFLFYGVQANAQAPKRIQFAKGKRSAVVNATTGAYGVSYVVRAKSGQKLVLNLTPISKIGIKVETIGTYGETVLLREEKGGTYEVRLEDSG